MIGTRRADCVYRRIHNIAETVGFERGRCNSLTIRRSDEERVAFEVTIGILS